MYFFQEKQLLPQACILPQLFITTLSQSCPLSSLFKPFLTFFRRKKTKVNLDSLNSKYLTTEMKLFRDLPKQLPTQLGNWKEDERSWGLELLWQGRKGEYQASSIHTAPAGPVLPLWHSDSFFFPEFLMRFVITYELWALWKIFSKDHKSVPKSYSESFMTQTQDSWTKSKAPITSVVISRSKIPVVKSWYFIMEIP